MKYEAVIGLEVHDNWKPSPKCLPELEPGLENLQTPLPIR